MQVSPSHVQFTFADGEKQAAGSLVSIPVPQLDGHVIDVHCVETPTPILLGLDVHAALGLVIDYQHKTVWSYKLRRFLDIRELPSGHFALDLRPLTHRE